MKKQKNILFLTMFLNFLVASIKLIFGIMLNFSSLIADAIHSLLDFITDIISNIASKIGKKRANKKYPFGYGMIENIANLFIGVILFLLALYVLITSFKITETQISSLVLVVLIITIILKIIVIYLLYHYGQRLKNNTLIVSAKESSTDLISSIIVLIISILLLFKDKYPNLIYADTIGSILISIVIFKISLTIIIDNISYLLGKTEENKDLTNEITELINKHKIIKDSSIKLMKIGTYYNLYINLELDTDITLKQLFNLEKKLKQELKKENYRIRFIEIEAEEYKEN